MGVLSGVIPDLAAVVRRRRRVGRRRRRRLDTSGERWASCARGWSGSNGRGDVGTGGDSVDVMGDRLRDALAAAFRVPRVAALAAEVHPGRPVSRAGLVTLENTQLPRFLRPAFCSEGGGGAVEFVRLQQGLALKAVTE